MRNRLSLLTLLFVAYIGTSQDMYTLSEQSELTISGTSTVHDWTIAANNMKGFLSHSGEIMDLGLKVPVSKIKSERGAAMDKKMHGALKLEQHPEIKFKFQEITKNNGFVINGRLRIAGVEQEVELPSDITLLNGSYTIKGEYKIALQDFGMEPPTAMFGQIVVGDMVTVSYNLVFVNP